MRFGRAIPFLATLALGFCGYWPGGIQAVLRYRPSQHALYIDHVAQGGASDRVGLRANDRIVSIDGAPVDALSEDEIRAKLRGEVGTRVRLGVVREGGVQDITVERGPYQ